tara:strand:- start:1034 stop:1387 length:354 start_codon:yes stop_codon:yes gene_type:complete
MNSEAQIRQLEKRARGFRILIAALNDLSMYGINPTIDKMLFVRIGELKEHLKKKITRNNEKLNEHYTTSVDSLIDDDGQSGELGVEKYLIKGYDTLEHKTSSDAEDLSYENDTRKDS